MMMMISSKPHLRFSSLPVTLRQTTRPQRRRVNVPRTRIFATYQSEAADDFEYVEEGDTGYEMANEDVMDRKKGVVKWFDNKKGFGFISQDDGSGDIFVHQTNINTSGYRSLREGEAVEFDAVYSEDGRLSAISVTGPDGREPLGSDRDSPFDQSFSRDNSYSRSSGGGGYNQGRFMSEPNTEISAFSSGLQVVVHNLPWSVAEDRLREFFADYNAVECEIQYDELGRSRGYGTVRFSTTEDAKEAILDLHGSQLDGRTVSVRFDRYG